MKWMARLVVFTTALVFGTFAASLFGHGFRPTVAPVTAPNATTPLTAESLLGTWQGKWGHNNGECTIEISRVEGNTFYGTLRKEGAVILFEGKFDPNTRMFYFDETEVVQLGDDLRGWSLGKNNGIATTDGHALFGLGRDDGGTYSWAAWN
jgi:hypothetical protein